LKLQSIEYNLESNLSQTHQCGRMVISNIFRARRWA